MGTSTRDVDEYCLLCGIVEKFRGYIRRSTDIDFEGFPPLIKLEKGNRTDVGQVACIRDEDVDLSEVSNSIERVVDRFCICDIRDDGSNPGLSVSIFDAGFCGEKGLFRPT